MVHTQFFSVAEVEPKQLFNLLKDLTPEWKTLATNLGIDPSTIDKIDLRLKINECFRSVLRKWITSSDDDKEPTFKVLYEALGTHGVSNPALARKIFKNLEVMELLVVSEEAKGSAYTPSYLCIVITAPPK